MGNEEKVIKDSGERREFNSGAVRDIQTGKGRMDLVPLDILAPLMETTEQADVLHHIGQFMETGQDMELYLAIRAFCDLVDWSISTALLEVSRQYEDGALKYGERNWEKGIDLHSYIDSGVRHFLKHIDGWDDEPHDRAFIWNMLGAIWTLKHHPELVDIPFKLIGNRHLQNVKIETADEVPSVSRDLLSDLFNEVNPSHNDSSSI